MKNTVIYHRADFDGLFSAAVCKKFLPDDTTFIGWDYGDDLIEFPADGTVYLVDLGPNCFKGIPADATKPERFIWIDHHLSSILQWDDQLGHPFNGYRIDGVAACRLCWQWFTSDQSNLPTLESYKERKVQEPLALTLAGEYDVWDKRDERADAFQFGLTARCHAGMGCEKELHNLLLTPEYYEEQRAIKFKTLQIVDEGRTAMAWQRQFASQVCAERSYIREWEGRTFCILGSPHARNSMWFPENELEPEVQALMCWRYDGKSVKFSLYHAPGHEDHDLSLIAKKYGGGGHRGACGFEMDLENAMEIIR